MKDLLRSSPFRRAASLLAMGEPFVLDLPPFEWDAPEPVILEFPEQLPADNLQEVPWNYDESTLLVRDEEVLKDGVTTITRSGRVLPDPEMDVQPKGKESSMPPKQPVSEKEAEEKPKKDPSPSTRKMKIPYEFLITPSSKPLVIPAAKNRKSSSNVVTISVTSDSEEEAKEGKQAMRVGLPLSPLVCHSSVEKAGGAIFVVPMTEVRGSFI